MKRAHFKLKWKPRKWWQKAIVLGFFIVGLLFIIATSNGNNMEGMPPESELQTIHECNCKRKFFYSRSANLTNSSSCSDEGSFYAPGQKVMSFSMRIKNPKNTGLVSLYRRGILENLRRMKDYYPGSTMRLYTDVSLEREPDYCPLVCDNPELHWCDVRKTPSLGDQFDSFLMTWRFLPLGDPTVEYFFSRDLDSVLIERQVVVVKEWLHKSDKAFHVIRDHALHGHPMLGGLWGVKNSLLGWEEGAALRKEIMARARKSKMKGDDQAILTEVVFKKHAKDMLAFDSYFCKASHLGNLTETRPFPVRRKDAHYDFAGNTGLGKNKYNLSKCPVECRPEYAKDWEYC